MKRVRHILGASAINVSALRTSPPFRLLFGAQLISTIGSQITVMAILYQVAHITGSPLQTGLVGLVQILPTVGFALAGGAIADAFDRRKLLLVAQVSMFCVSASLAVLSWDGNPALWVIYALAACNAAFSSIDGPARQSVIPMLVDAATLRSAVQLREALTQSGRVFGPLFGALIIQQYSIAAAYAADALSFVLAFGLFWRLPTLRPTTRRRFELSSITEGLRYVGRAPILAATFIADLIAMVFGMPRAVLPFFATTVFAVGPFGFGVLFAAIPAGALVGLLFAGLTERVMREGLAVLIAISIWGAAIAAFAFTPWFWVAVLLLAIAGAADMVSAIFRQTILLATVPDELRGRMSSVHIMVVTGGPPLGDLEAGVAADVLGLRQSVLAGGLACIGGMMILSARVPQFARWVDPKRQSASRQA